MTTYLYLIKVKLLTSLAYRFEVWSSLVSKLVLLLTTVFIWQTTYRNVSSVEGVSRLQMIDYAILAILIGTLFQNGVQTAINQRVRRGEIAIDLIRPCSLLGQYLARDIGAALAGVVMFIVPLLLVAIVFLHLPRPASVAAGVLFVPSVILSFGINWVMAALVGATAFWVTEFGYLDKIKDHLVRFLSGSIVPIWFFPGPVQAVSRFLPFQYTYQLPLGILIGKYSPREAMAGLMIQVIWLIALGVLLRLTWTRATRRLQVMGG